MTDFEFYHAGCTGPKGPKQALYAARRGLRRLLRPMFVRLADILRALSDRLDGHARRLDASEGRLDRVEDRLQATVAFGWDYVAMVRRLSALEDQVAALRDEAERRSRAA